ncbi:MAG: glycosyltransferase [Bacteroidia bacterium]
MKILYISYDGMTDPLGQSQVIPYLKGLAAKGHKITITSCEKSVRFKEQQESIKILLENAQIIWLPVLYATLPSILSKQLNIYRLQQKAKNACKNNKFDFVHCRSYMASLIGLKIKQQHKTKFIFDMRGFWADERIDGNIWSKKNRIQNYLYHYFKKKELEFLLAADYTITLTENAKKEINSWKSLKNNVIPMQVIPCCADLDFFSIKNINLAKQKIIQQELGISSSDFILSYLGSLGTWYLLDEMLDFFNCLLKIKPESKFLFITPDNQESIISKAQSKGISTSKLIIRAAIRNDVPLYLSLSQLSIYFIKPCYSKKASSPTKMAELMAMGIPVITNSGIGDSDELLADSNAGILVNSFNTTEYMRIINQIYLLLQMDRNLIVDKAQQHFSLEKGIALYQTVYEKLATKKTV